MKEWRHRIVGICVVICAVVLLSLIAGVVYLSRTAAPIQRFSYDLQPLGRSLGHDAPTDPKLRSMVRRAQLDYVVNPIPDIGRTVLHLNEIRTDGNMIEIVFDPSGVLDIFVIYRFSSDGQMLWKIAMS